MRILLALFLCISIKEIASSAIGAGKHEIDAENSESSNSKLASLRELQEVIRENHREGRQGTIEKIHTDIERF